MATYFEAPLCNTRFSRSGAYSDKYMAPCTAHTISQLPHIGHRLACVAPSGCLVRSKSRRPVHAYQPEFWSQPNQPPTLRRCQHPISQTGSHRQLQSWLLPEATSQNRATSSHLHLSRLILGTQCTGVAGSGSALTPLFSARRRNPSAHV